jgi:hypothetical protein
MPARVLGYGEISTVFAIQADGLEGLAFKRLPLFQSMEEVEPYRFAYEEYNHFLQQEVGLHLPEHGCAAFTNQAGRPVFYIVQKQVSAPSIGSQALHFLPTEMVPILIRGVLRELRRVWDYNRQQERQRDRRRQLAIDGQISNWSIQGFDSEEPQVDESTRFLYLDTSTPLFRVNGAEQLNPELFLRSAPSFLAWILRLFFMSDVVNRYYDFHRVAVDLVANLYKEQRPDLIPDAIDTVNSFFAGEAAELGIKPLTGEEIRSYYREDALIWTLYLSMRRLDRFLRTRLLRQEYPYILPGEIRR